MPIKIFKATLLAGMSFVLVSCAAGNQALQSVGDSMSKAAAAIDESLKTDTGSASVSREKNVLPEGLKGILAPEKKSASNYPRIALALSNFDKVLWQRPQMQNLNGCMDVAATLWSSASSSKVINFKYCSTENTVYNVPWKELGYYWTFGFKTGAMAQKAPRKGDRNGPETPKTFWPMAQEDLDFLGVDYNSAAVEVLNSGVALGVASLIYYFDLDWEKTDDQRIWVSTIDHSGYAPSSLYKVPVYKTP